MTKEEAIKAVSEGKKVRHRYFSDNEWITEIDGMIHSEDGIICDTTTFWSYRTLPGWESDWEII